MAEFRWTPEQAAAITAPGDVLLAASAGTGKTTTIVGKLLWHLGLPIGVREDTGEPIPPCPRPCSLDEIAAITFTEKAAYDLKAKLRKELESAPGGDSLRWEVDRASVGTIHAFCAELLREHALRLGIDPTFRVLDERETRLRQDEIIRDVVFERLQARDEGTVELVKRFGLRGQGRRPGTVDHVRSALRDLRWRHRRYGEWAADGRLDIEALVSMAVAGGVWPADGPAPEGDVRGLADAAALHRLAHGAARAWEEWLAAEGVRDFDSLILDARRLLTRADTRPALEGIRRRYRILVMDEFQDTDGAQRDIAFAIAGIGAGEGKVAARPRLFLVGDPKQSIYRFRGADITVWNETASVLCGDGGPMQLTRNFRSEPAVVAFVNRAPGRAMEELAKALARESPGSRVGYRELEADRPPTRAAGVEWLPADDGDGKPDRGEAEARLVVSRVLELVGNVSVVDPETGRHRRCHRRDIAVLARKRVNLTSIETALRRAEVPCYNTATAGLSGRQEVLDLVTTLRVLHNPRDDLRAFAFLRSPFVGLRDEVLARIRLDRATGRTSFLRQAERFLEEVEVGGLEPFAAPESPLVHEVEREALRTGLRALREARPLVDRVDHAELLETVLRETGYRLHLLLRSGSEEALANIERFLALLEEYRHLPLGSLLLLWERWDEEDLGIPQAPLFSEEDDVVTLSTIHMAKGLEWPVVILAATREGPDSGGNLTHEYWSDRELGPVFLPKKDERGNRSMRLHRRRVLEEQAEEARLLYVACTRARDRLILVGPTLKPTGYAAWLSVALDDAVEAHEAGAGEVGAGGVAEPGPEGGDRRPSHRSNDEDAATGTGRQLDAFGFDHDPEDGDGQLSLFPARPPEGEGAERRVPAPRGEAGAPAAADPAFASLPVVIHRPGGALQSRLEEPPISLWWLEGIVEGKAPALVHPIGTPARSFLTSATELMLRERHEARREGGAEEAPTEWELRYVHGVQPVWRFAPTSSGADGLLPELRGQVIHGVLERIEDAREIARLLRETIAGIDTPELEELLDAESAYREALEREIERVVRSPEWAWYVAPPHDRRLHREMRFIRLVGPREWRQGAFDLHRPAVAGPAPPSPAGPESERDLHPWIVDFKTHRVTEAEVGRVAEEYAVQAEVYREAAGALLPRAPDCGASGEVPAVRVLLHFTHPNVAVEV